MNGVHDMGGMHGLGPIDPEPDEPVFHEPWEPRVLALTLAVGSQGRWNLDSVRHERESIVGRDYLRMTYYEIWLTALSELLVRHGFATRAELASGQPARGVTKLTPRLTADQVPELLARRRPYTRELDREPLFAVGATVRVRNLHPVGHTRAPRYVRGKLGVIAGCHGHHVFPDKNAHSLGEQPAPLYHVRFAAPELWGAEANPLDSVHLDLWEPYLEPV